MLRRQTTFYQHRGVAVRKRNARLCEIAPAAFSSRRAGKYRDGFIFRPQGNALLPTCRNREFRFSSDRNSLFRPELGDERKTPRCRHDSTSSTN